MHQPDDPGPPDPDDWDPTGYYRRKAKKADAMIPYLAWMFAAGLIIVSGVLAWRVFVN